MIRPRLPFTLGLIGTVLAANALAGALRGPLPGKTLRAYGLSLESLEAGHVERLLTAVPLSHDPAMLVRQLALALVVVGGAEWRIGTRRTAGVFLTADVAGSILLMAGVWIGREIGSPAAATLAGTYDVGLSGGAFGALGALVASLPKPQRNGMAVAGFLGLAFAWGVGADPLADLLHPIAFALGLLMEFGARSDSIA